MTPHDEAKMLDFHNRLRILLNIDEIEFAHVSLDDTRWAKFASNPFRYFITCDDETCRKLWRLIEERATRKAQS